MLYFYEILQDSSVICAVGLFFVIVFLFLFEIITLQMLDDSISTKKEEEKNKINKITGNKTHKYSK